MSGLGSAIPPPEYPLPWVETPSKGTPSLEGDLPERNIGPGIKTGSGIIHIQSHRITDRCKNIIFPQLQWWAVTIIPSNKKAFQWNANRPLTDSLCFIVNKFERIHWDGGGTRTGVRHGRKYYLPPTSFAGGNTQLTLILISKLQSSFFFQNEKVRRIGHNHPFMYISILGQVSEYFVNFFSLNSSN